MWEWMCVQVLFSINRPAAVEIQHDRKAAGSGDVLGAKDIEVQTIFGFVAEHDVVTRAEGNQKKKKKIKMGLKAWMFFVFCCFFFFSTFIHSVSQSVSSSFIIKFIRWASHSSIKHFSLCSGLSALAIFTHLSRHTGPKRSALRTPSLFDITHTDPHTHTVSLTCRPKAASLAHLLPLWHNTHTHTQFHSLVDAHRSKAIGLAHPLPLWKRLWRRPAQRAHWRNRKGNA